MENLDKYDFESLEPFTDLEFQEAYKDGVALVTLAEQNGLAKVYELDDRFGTEAQDFFGMVDIRLSNTNLNPKKPEMKDLSPALALMEMILTVFHEDDNYSFYARGKMSLLFKMGHAEEAEDYMKRYLKEHPLDTYAYLELATCFDGMCHNPKKAVEYLKLGLSQEGLEDREELLDFLSDYEEC